MRHILTSVVLVVFLLPACAPGQVVTMDDLVVRDGLYYEKLTNVPFTGVVTGQYQGRIKDGRKDGPWVFYYENGGVSSEGIYKDGKRDGPWVSYYENGQLRSEITYKDGGILYAPKRFYR